MGEGEDPPPRPAGKFLRFYHLQMAFPCIWDSIQQPFVFIIYITIRHCFNTIAFCSPSIVIFCSISYSVFWRMKITNKAIFGGWIGGGVPVGCTGGVNRCRSYLRYQKTQKLKISNFALTPLIHTWAVRSTRCQYAHYSAQFSIKGVTPNITFRVNDENVKLIFFH